VTDYYLHPEYPAFLAAIRAAPADDLPRLVLADRLDEWGEHDRAELIRLQVRMAHQETVDGDGSAWCSRCENYAWPEKFTRWCRGEVCRLRRRVVALFARHRSEWVKSAFAHAHDAHTRYVTGPDFRPTPPLEEGPFLWLFRRELAAFRRGFVDRVTCPSAAWLPHGDAILAREPVTTVRLTTWPEVEYRWVAFPCWEIVGDPSPRPLPFEAVRDHPGGQIAGALAARWPGVEFELPPGPELTARPITGDGAVFDNYPVTRWAVVNEPTHPTGDLLFLRTIPDRPPA
jgi:uncharacterized protein (TIGR02996 family)